VIVFVLHQLLQRLFYAGNELGYGFALNYAAKNLPSIKKLQ
jgi:hypothetical protein